MLPKLPEGTVKLTLLRAVTPGYVLVTPSSNSPLGVVSGLRVLSATSVITSLTSTCVASVGWFACAEAGSCLVIEANPEAYGADFCTRLEESVELVEAAGSPGFGLHVDAGGIALSGENFEAAMRQAAPLIRHVHASQPNLVSFSEPDPVHSRIAAILRETGYTSSIAIEMRAQPEGLEAVRQAVAEVKKIYHG